MELRKGVGEIPPDAVVSFGTKTGRQRGLQGIVFGAVLSVHAEPDVEGCMKDDSKELAADQPVIPGIGFALEASIDDRVAYLEQQVSQLVMMVNMLKTQNMDLTSRVTFLETCECHPSCSFNGTTFTEGQLWAPDMCTVCECVHGRPNCRTRMDVPSCVVPCMGSPCQHSGSCLDVGPVSDMDVMTEGFQCQCPPPFTGPTCQIRHNPCVWPPAGGDCDGQLGRFYYDRITQQCLPFNYTGCGGNVNNYEHIEQCVTVAMEGACCYRTFSTSRESVVGNRQNLQLHCEATGGLEAMENGVTTTEESEVVSFYPGLVCEEAGCLAAEKNCTVGQQMYTSGETFRLGCQQCMCLDGGVLNCTCRRVDVRRELRDMTREEIVQFQRAVAQLRLSSENRVWEQFRDLYMTHRMHASGAPYFLPWHRYFLRQLEQKLQEIDCSIVLPYFDFTTDVGNFSQAIIWQANYFGGNGNESGGDCVPDHPFGDPERVGSLV
ncbi:hypothetical protein BaRGS_00032466 [Batillaria attramentaria]|uniref:Uncharacterized protein n=1 Tax=Batillaria attramentaria TaxID=370345 RepID=A0ABD0JMK0_9CAEN